MDIIIICLTVCVCVCVCVRVHTKKKRKLCCYILSDYCVGSATGNGKEIRKSNGMYPSPSTSAHHVLIVITLNYCKYVVSSSVYINIHVFQPLPWDIKLPLGTM